MQSQEQISTSSVRGGNCSLQDSSCLGSTSQNMQRQPLRLHVSTLTLNGKLNQMAWRKKWQNISFMQKIL